MNGQTKGREGLEAELADQKRIVWAVSTNEIERGLPCLRCGYGGCEDEDNSWYYDGRLPMGDGIVPEITDEVRDAIDASPGSPYYTEAPQEVERA